MKKDIADRFIAALRSGQYEQAHHTLIFTRRDGTVTHCCLSVLCQLAIADGVPIRQGKKHYFWDDGSEVSVLPPAVAEWAGMTSRNGEYVSDGEARSLEGDNDVRALDFHQIADVVEQHWEQL